MRVFIFICFFIGISYQGANAESFFDGEWVVESVQVDRLTERTQQYTIDDPRLNGRIFRFSESMNIGPNNIKCKKPTYSETNKNLAELINKTFNGNEQVLADIDMQLPKESYVFYVSCLGDSPAEKLEARNWIVKFKENKLLVSGEGPTVLLLARLESNTVPMPAFDCGKSSGYIEKSICASHELALFDRSLKHAYSMVSVELSTVQKNRFKARQLDWLKERNLCKDTECIKNSYEKRLEEIMGNQWE